jgi:membrane-associated phospholipid phosphatase
MRKVRPGWWFDGVLLAAFVLLTLLLTWRTKLLGVDLAVRDFVDAHRPTWFYVLLRVLNYFGQGGQVLTPLAVLAALVRARRTRSLRPFLPVVGAFLILYGTVGPLKLWSDRAAASEKHLPHPEWLFHDPSGLSYPSGHVVNSIVWYGVLAFLLGDWLTERQRGLVRFAIPALVVFTTTYLSYHWITDGAAAVCVGLILDRILARIPWHRVPLGRFDHLGRRSDVHAGA